MAGEDHSFKACIRSLAKADPKGIRWGECCHPTADEANFPMSNCVMAMTCGGDAAPIVVL